MDRIIKQGEFFFFTRDHLHIIIAQYSARGVILAVTRRRTHVADNTSATILILMN